VGNTTRPYSGSFVERENGEKQRETERERTEREQRENRERTERERRTLEEYQRIELRKRASGVTYLYVAGA
jgi:hypothetical protein